MYSDLKENDIFIGIKNKNIEVFHYLYANYFYSLTLFAESYLFNEADAQDLVQDLFYHLWTKSFDETEIKSIKAYLYKAVRNRCLTLLKSKCVIDTLSDVDSDKLIMECCDQSEINEYLYARLYEVLNELPPRCKEIFMLKIVDGYKNREIAEKLDIAETTVKTQVQRAYALMRNKMIPFIFVIEILRSDYL